MADDPQSFTEYVLEAVEHLIGGLITEREFATKIARAAAGEQPDTDEATDRYFEDGMPEEGKKQ